MSCSFQEGERCKQVSWVLRGREAPKGPVATRKHGKAGQWWINIRQHSSLGKSFKNMWLWCSGCLPRWHKPGFAYESCGSAPLWYRKGQRVTISCYPLCESLSWLLSHGRTRIHPVWQIHMELLIWATPRPLVKPDYMSVTSYFGRKKPLRWNWEGTETEPCWLQQGFISPQAWPAPLTLCPVPKTLNPKHWKQRAILGAHFRGSLCRFTQMTLCKTGASSTQKSSSRIKLEGICPCNICKSVTLRASPQLVHFILNTEAVLRSWILFSCDISE